MSKHRSLIGLVTALAASAAVVPLVVSAHRRARRRTGDYTETPEFQTLVSGYLI